MTPARVQPMARAYDSASARPFPVTSWWTASRPGVPPPSVNTSRTRWPGAFGATIVTSTSVGGTIQLKRTAKPCANISILPAVRCCLMSAV